MPNASVPTSSSESSKSSSPVTSASSLSPSASSKSFYVLTFVIGIVGILFAFLPTDNYLMNSCPRVIQQWRNQVSAWFVIPSATPSLYSSSSTDDIVTNEDGLRFFTLEELKQYDGNDPNKPILLGMNGDIFDVTEKGKQFYGKDAAYQIFAGKDSTRALTLGSLDPKDIYERTDTDDFNEQQLKALKEQHEFYLGKYPRVGKLKKVERLSDN